MSKAVGSIPSHSDVTSCCDNKYPLALTMEYGSKEIVHKIYPVISAIQSIHERVRAREDSFSGKYCLNNIGKRISDENRRVH